MTKDVRNVAPDEFATRFKKGASGNPKGRTKQKAPPNKNPLEAIWDRKITVPGRKRRISYRAFCVKQKVPKCIQGDLDEIQGLLALRRDGVTGKAPPRGTRVIVQNEDGTYDE